MEIGFQALITITGMMIRYSGGLIAWGKEEIEVTDVTKRKLYTMPKVFLFRAAIYLANYQLTRYN